MASSRRLLAFIGVGAVPLACSVATSFDGLSGGNGNPNVDPDSATNTLDVRTSEAASAEAAASDGSSIFDAGADVAVAADAAEKSDGAPFCASLVPAATFCDDFDIGPLGQGWSAQTLTNFSLDDIAFSAPKSARAFVTDQTCSGPSMTHDENGAFASVRVEMMLYPGLDDGGLNSETTVLALYTASADTSMNSCTFIVQQSDGAIGVGVQEFNSASNIAASAYYPSDRYPVAGQWTKFALQVQADSSGHPSISAYVNDQLSVKSVVRTGCNMAAGAGFTIGVNCSKSGAAQMRYDNVRFDVK